MSDARQGRELHREFVGMLFALAIAEVAVEGVAVSNGNLPLNEALPAYSHLVLAAAIIAASWVGWGWSEHSLSDVRNVFTKDFVELLLDLWLVAIYFFIAKGVELPVIQRGGQAVIVPSLSSEMTWVMWMFITYVAWDLLTKWGKRDKQERPLFLQRGWASMVCAAFAISAYLLIPDSPSSRRVVLADAFLLVLVFVFRAMKIRNLGDLTRKDLILIGALSSVMIACLMTLMGIGPMAPLIA